MANFAAVTSDTSSAAAGTTPVIGVAVAAFWAASVEPIPAKRLAAAVSDSGCAVTKTIGVLLAVRCRARGLWLCQARTDTTSQRSCWVREWPRQKPIQAEATPGSGGNETAINLK